MKDNMLSLGNPYVHIVDPRKGDLKNRAACAGETALNNVKTNLQATGVVAGTALAVDTFTGGKKALSAFAEKFPNAAAALKNFKNNVVDVSKKLMDNNVVKNVVSKAKNVASKVAKKLPNLTDFAKFVVEKVKANKKTAIIAAGATAVMAIITKQAHKDGRIEQKYEDKARLEQANREFGPKFE